MPPHSNLVVIFGVLVFYTFIFWGVDSLYGVENPGIITNPGELGEVSALTMFDRISDFVSMIFKISTFSDPRVPTEITALVITPLNFLLFGSIVFLIRGGGT